LNVDRDFTNSYRFGTNARSKELKNIGSFYSNSIQADDYFVTPHLTTKRDLSEVAFINDSLVMDESYQDQKNLVNLYIGKSSTPLMVSNTYNYPQSHHAVLNAFRADFEDFSHFQDNSLDLSKLYSTNTTSGTDSNLFSLKSQNIKFGDKSLPNTGVALENLQSVNYDANPSQLN
jgi:hypothetical protein